MTTVKRVKHIDVVGRTKEAAEIAVLAVAEQGVALAVPLVPVNKQGGGGKLKGSINAQKTGKYTATFGSWVDYAPYVEFDTKPHTITAKGKGLTNGKSWFGKTVQHPGTTAQPFLRPAADNLKKSGSRIFAKILKGVLNHG